MSIRVHWSAQSPRTIVFVSQEASVCVSRPFDIPEKMSHVSQRGKDFLFGSTT